MTENGVTTARPAASRQECLVSIVVVNWNTRELLRQCLESTLAAGVGLGHGIEIVVVDNASRDGSAQMVRDRFPGVRLVTNAANSGFAAGTNQGIRQSSGRYVLLLNPDTSATVAFLRVLVAFLEEHPDVAAAGPRLIGRDGQDQVSCFPLPTLGRELWRLFHLDTVHSYASYPQSQLRSRDPQRVESIQGACLLVRREALEQAGLLDERFFVYTEEIDLCRRLLDRGWQIFWVPQAVIVHYGGASTSQVGGRMFLQLYRSKLQYFRKHLGFWGGVGYKVVLLAATLPRLVVPALGIAFVPSHREKWRGVLSNYSTLLVQLPAL